MTLNADKVAKDYYGHKAAVYDQENDGTEKRIKEYIALERYLASEEPCSSLLDVPVGTGYFFPIYEKYFFEVLGLDVSREMLVQAYNKITNGNIKIGEGSIFNLDMPSKTVDIAVCIRLLNFFTYEELIKALDELCRVTKKTIILSLRTGDPATSTKRCNVHSFLSFKYALSERDFEIVDSTLVGKDNYRIYRICAR